MAKTNKYDEMKAALDERFCDEDGFDVQYFKDMIELEPFNDYDSYKFMKSHWESPIAAHRGIMYVVRHTFEVPASVTWCEVAKYLRGKRVYRDVMKHAMEYIRQSFEEK